MDGADAAAGVPDFECRGGKRCASGEPGERLPVPVNVAGGGGGGGGLGGGGQLLLFCFGCK